MRPQTPGKNESISWLTKYFHLYQEALSNQEITEQLILFKDLLCKKKTKGRKVIMAGNGGSAAIASHCCVDLTKNAGIRCINFNEADLITCLANDYGYERWLEKAIELYADSGDLVVLISSSGKSPNILRAAEYAQTRGLEIVTFSGFDADNPLRSRGSLNFWVDSHAYNVVEMTHHIWILGVCDLIIGKAEYPAS